MTELLFLTNPLKIKKYVKDTVLVTIDKNGLGVTRRTHQLTAHLQAAR